MAEAFLSADCGGHGGAGYSVCTFHGPPQLADRDRCRHRRGHQLPRDNSLFGAMGNVNYLPASMAAWSADVLFALAGGYLLLRTPT
jgi:hypothetical protein